MRSLLKTKGAGLVRCVLESRRLQAFEGRKFQKHLRRQIVKAVETAGTLAAKNGGADPGARAIGLRDDQRFDFVSRITEILKNTHLWERVPERETKVRTAWLLWLGTKTIPSRQQLRQSISEWLGEHDYLERKFRSRS